MTEETQPKPQIIEAFHDYSPPFDVTKVIRRMLRGVPPHFLHGLNSIVLTNVAALGRQERDKRTRGRGQRTTLGEALGYYTEAWKGEPAALEFSWTISKSSQDVLGCASDLFETCYFRIFSFMSWATTFIGSIVVSTRDVRMSRTSGARNYRVSSSATAIGTWCLWLYRSP